MERKTTLSRRNWQKIVESQGMLFHTPNGKRYWDETAFYEFHSSEIDAIETATYALDKMCLEAVQHVIDEDLWREFRIPPGAVDFIKWSWENDNRSVYGRFDLMVDGTRPPKMLEYNADTPTGLLEAAVIQWQWMKDCQGELPYTVDQFNSIHERLIEAWVDILWKFPDSYLHFTSVKDDSKEDVMTANYLRDTAMQAGFLKTKFLYMEDLRWDHDNKVFVDEEARPITMCFKLYPWEWMFNDVQDPDCVFGPDVRLDRTMWLEPAWKCILSNKAILAILWKLFPNHPNLLRAEFAPFNENYAKKPILSREGANVTLVLNGNVVAETDGEYTYSPYVYQDLALLPDFDGNFPVVGSWMVNGWACGIGIREANTLVTGNLSRFVPHLFRR
jgi:glutathionylspermidine synthase